MPVRTLFKTVVARISLSIFSSFIILGLALMSALVDDWTSFRTVYFRTDLGIPKCEKCIIKTTWDRTYFKTFLFLSRGRAPSSPTAQCFESAVLFAGLRECSPLLHFRTTSRFCPSAAAIFTGPRIQLQRTCQITSRANFVIASININDDDDKSAWAICCDESDITFGLINFDRRRNTIRWVRSRESIRQWCNLHFRPGDDTIM